MKCTDLEILICDYVDQTLTPQEKATVELHLATCAACREMVADATAAISFMERTAEIEPPPALVNKILFEARSGKAAPVKPQGGFRGWISRWLEPVVQPKFAMGMVVTILSFSLLGRFAGINPRQITAKDLEPARLWHSLEDKTTRTYERAVKYYQSLRLVFEMQQALKDWKDEEAAAPASPTPSEGPIERPKPAEEKTTNRPEGGKRQ